MGEFPGNLIFFVLQYSTIYNTFVYGACSFTGYTNPVQSKLCDNKLFFNTSIRLQINIIFNQHTHISTKHKYLAGETSLHLEMVEQEDARKILFAWTTQRAVIVENIFSFWCHENFQGFYKQIEHRSRFQDESLRCQNHQKSIQACEAHAHTHTQVPFCIFVRKIHHTCWIPQNSRVSPELEKFQK